MYHHIKMDRSLFDDRTLRCKVAFEYGDPALGMYWVIQGLDDTGIGPGVYRCKAFQVPGHGITCHGKNIKGQHVTQSLHHGRHAARTFEVKQEMVPARSQVGQVGCGAAHLIEPVQRQIHPELVGYGWQVQGRIGTAADGHIQYNGIVDGLRGYYLPGSDVLLHQFHDLHPGLFGQPELLCIHGMGGAAARQAHAECFCDTGHCIGGK